MAANELTVAPRSLRAGQLTTITITLEGDFAAADAVNIPLFNLALTGEPWVATEFAWINGETTRRKIFRYRARAEGAGPARVGPIVLTTSDGQRDTLDAVAVQVEADRAGSSNDAERVLRELIASGREPLFVIAAADRQRVYAGEPVIVTWTLYNATAIQQWHVAGIPKLAEFWTEELERDHGTERVYVGDTMLQSMVVRRAALFPLRTGTLTIEGLTVEASVMERIRGGPFAMFEGNLVDTAFTSAPLTIEVLPVPAGPKVDAVGDLRLTCEPPSQARGGPVVLRAVLSGRGNVRAAAPPRFERAVEGRVEIEAGQVTVDASGPSLMMTRQWQYLILPSRSGRLTVPPLALRIFDPASGQRRELRCGATTLEVSAVTPSAAAPQSPPVPMKRRLSWRWLVPAAALLLTLLLGARWAMRELRLRREVASIMRGATPADVRERIEERFDVAALMLDRTARGDAWRALRSILDAAERERDIAGDAEREIRSRLRELLALR